MEFEPSYLMGTGILFVIISVALWALDFVGAWQVWEKVIINILMLPICYVIVAIMANK